MYYGHLAYLKSYKIKELMFKSVTVTVSIPIYSLRLEYSNIDNLCYKSVNFVCYREYIEILIL